MRKLLAVLGVILILAGAISLYMEKVSYKTDEKVLEIGSVEATVEKEKELHIPQAYGIISIIVGVFLLAILIKRKN